VRKAAQSCAAAATAKLRKAAQSYAAAAQRLRGGYAAAAQAHAAATRRLRKAT